MSDAIVFALRTPRELSQVGRHRVSETKNYYTGLSRSTTQVNPVPKPTSSRESKRRGYPVSFVLLHMKKIVFFSLVASSLGRVPPAKKAKPGPLLCIAWAARALDGKFQNAIPDAVLNSTKCIVVIPSITGGTLNVSAGGVASCREAADSWSAPTFVKFNGRGVRGHRTDLLVFVLGDAGLRALRSGECRSEDRNGQLRLLWLQLQLPPRSN